MRVVVKSDKCIEPPIDIDLPRTISKEACIAEIVINDGSIVDPIATAYDGFVIQRVGKAKAWSKIGSVRGHESKMRGLQATLSNCSDDCSASSACGGIWCVRIKAAQESARLFTGSTIVVSDTEVY